jgi:hypothetical protein
MRLSPESFRDLTTALNGRMPSGKERRRSTRVEVKTRIPLSMVSKGMHLPAVPVMVRDVSPRGINILYPQSLATGQQFTVRLKGSEKTIRLLCTVMHSRQVSNGLHSIGAEFTCVLPASGSHLAGDAKTMSRIRDSVLD